MADKQEKEKPVSNTMQVNDFGNRIYTIRGKQVMLDYELAALYGYEVRALNQQVKRNIERFPDDFMFQLTKEEVEGVKSQFVISPLPIHNEYRAQGVRYLVFTLVRKEGAENPLMLLLNREFICWLQY